MSRLSHELNVLQQQWLTIAPDGTSLSLLGDELSLQALGRGAKKLNSAYLKSAGSRAKSLLSLELGVKSAYRMNLLCLGFDLQHSPPPQGLGGVVDLSVLFFPLSPQGLNEHTDMEWIRSSFEAFLSMDPLVKGALEARPVVLVGRGWNFLLSSNVTLEGNLGAERDFMSRACWEWINRNFSKSKVIPAEDAFFMESLDWILSFS
jgi:hypothetical protein